ncbi:hypothetical protein EV197_0371 [Aquimarina brevivitae]|uniref:Glycosyl-4,4'-diaponeurosporenoate acyltransferase n=2 Tax=Aquimarina brevivitae TaxID=323412 RepID=A0A4Q7PJS2_9FLAO|nr:hypothetical protein EV197_0371 [Aquimarina brevivitae]
MLTKHIISGFLFGLSVSLISWTVGLILNSILAKRRYYQKLSHLNFITSSKLNRRIGLRYFKWVVKNTPFKYFNTQLKLGPKNKDLRQIRYQMTLAETSHLIGFILVMLVAVYYSITKGLVFGSFVMLANILMNLYPSLLQQQNKRRIDQLIRKLNNVNRDTVR